MHEPNLCIYKTCCMDCINNPESECTKCDGTNGERIQVSMNRDHNPTNQEPVEWFLSLVLEQRKVSDR